LQVVEEAVLNVALLGDAGHRDDSMSLLAT
jgi:hypothetical protein